jgi:AraC-like DNA-binding protein
MYVSITLVRALVDELQRQGISLRELCTRADVSPTELAESSLRLGIDRYNRVVRSARELSTIPSFGLRVGASSPAGALNVVGYILAVCGTIREAFQNFLQYSSLVKEAARWQLIEEGDVARFVYEHGVMDPDNAVFDAEACLAIVIKIARQFVGPGAQLEVVRFRHAAPAYAAEYTPIFSTLVLFGQANNEIVFPRHLLDVEQVHRDDRLHALLKERAEELLEQRQSKEAFVEHLRDLLRLEAESGTPQVSRLAARLGLSPRSLERHVRDQGLSLTALTEAARRDAACAALRLPLASIKDVSHRLGFSEPSAFHRAFKRWTGMTPAQYRHAHSCGKAL